MGEALPAPAFQVRPESASHSFALMTFCIISIHAPACNIPTSFPRILVPVGSPQQTAGAFSSIVTSHDSSTLFAAFSSLADDCLRRHTDVVDKLGLERDDVRQLRDELQALEDIYKVDEGLEDVEMDEQY